MFQSFSALVGSVRGHGGIRASVTVSVRSLLFAAVVGSHLVFANPVHESSGDTLSRKQSDVFLKNGIPFGILPNVTFDFTAEEVLERCHATIASHKATCDLIASVPLKECTYDRVIRPWILADAQFMMTSMTQSFPQFVSPDQAIRDASAKAARLRDDYHIAASAREDLFLAVQAVSERPADELARMNEEERRFLVKTLLAFRDSGHFLDEENRFVLKAKRCRILKLCAEFSKTLSDDTTEVLFSAEELSGVAKGFMAGLVKDEETGKYRVSMKSPNPEHVLCNAYSERVRKQMVAAYNQRCKTNLHVLAEVVKLRHECAQLLGYPDHATFCIKDTMAKEPERVLSFLRGLQAEWMPCATAELARLTELKAQDLGLPVDQVQFHSWDYLYYERELKYRAFPSNRSPIREYFSLEHVTKEMLRICEETFGLRFRKVLNAHTRRLVWHEDVTLWEVWNAEGYIQPNTVTAHDGEFVGYLYLDLLSRPGKSTHASCWDMQPGCQLSEDGTRQFSATAIVTNFDRPTATRPSLMEHYEVTYLFHEMGHALHDMCSHVKLPHFHGTRVERDFIEAPSQMLENWCWDEKMLARLSRHYLRKDESLPHDLYVALINSRDLNAGLTDLKCVFHSLFDLTIHSGSEYHSADAISALYERLRHEVTLIPQPQNVWPAATFWLIVSGYDATIYGYLWGEVLAADMFHSRFADALENPAEVGRLYRNSILRPGGSRDGMESLVEFLGREPNMEPFLRSLGLE